MFLRVEVLDHLFDHGRWNGFGSENANFVGRIPIKFGSLRPEVFEIALQGAETIVHLLVV